MAWNEPGGGNRDPWGGRNDQGPPDLDEVVRKLQEKLGGIFGGGKKGGGASGGSLPKGVLQIALLLAFIAWIGAGLYTVEEGKTGVETTLGAYSDSTGAGLQWIARPFQEVRIVDTQKIHSKEIGYRSSRQNRTGGSVTKESLMLTEDENIIDIRLAVQYKVNNAKDYLFNVADPDDVLKQATESAIRHVVGQSKMDYILKEGRAKIASDARRILQKTLNTYSAGLDIVQVAMQDAQPPAEVQEAFTDAVKAQEDRERLINEAEAYAKDILPKANGLASRRVEEAIGYRAQVIAEATGETRRFAKILVEYEKAPKITRQRLYLESMEYVLSHTSKVLIDVESGNSLMYLPLDKIIANPGNRPFESVPSTLSPHTPSGVQREAEATSTRRTRIRGIN